MRLPSIPIPVRLALCSAAVFAVMGLHLPFWPVWLEDHHVRPEQIGILIAMGYFIRAIVGPGVSILADRIGDRRMPLIVVSSLFTFSYVMFNFTDGFWPIFIVSLFAFAGASPQVPLKESVVMGFVALKGYDYGRIRLWGSLAFIVMTMVGGSILGAFGTQGILTGIIILGALVIVAAWLLPPDPRKGEAAAAPLRMSAVVRLVRTPTFLIFMAAVSVTMAAHAVYYAFGTLNWQRLGYSDTFIGILWGLGVAAEIILFAFSARVLKVLSPLQLIVLAGCAAILRWVLTAFEPHWMLLIPIQCLQAFTFGALHLGAMHYIARYVPANVSASAMGLLAATSGGLGIGLATIAAGGLYSEFHSFAYFFSAILGALGLALAIWLNRMHAGVTEPQIS